MSNSVIGVDIGGTNIRVGLVNENLHLVRKEMALTSGFQSADEMWKQIKKMIEQVDGEKKANKIGIALPVPWKDNTEFIMDATNIPCLESIHIGEIKSYFQGYDVYFENDVNVIALLESEYGAAKDYRQSMYITISTGIGSGMIFNKEIHHGAHGYAGEIGSMIVSDSKKNYSSLYNGTLESLCSGLALEEESKSLYGQDATIQMLFEMYQKEDEKAVEVIKLWVEYFSNAIASLMQTIDPDIFVVGGGVISNNQWLLEEVNESVKHKVFEHLRDKIKIVMSKFGPDGGIIGAGNMALNHSKGE